MNVEVVYSHLMPPQVQNCDRGKMPNICCQAISKRDTVQQNLFGASTSENSILVSKESSKRKYKIS